MKTKEQHEELVKKVAMQLAGYMADVICVYTEMKPSERWETVQRAAVEQWPTMVDRARRMIETVEEG